MANGIERSGDRRYYVLEITVICDMTPCRQTEKMGMLRRTLLLPSSGYKLKIGVTGIFKILVPMLRHYITEDRNLHIKCMFML
jgi:hypothetical protein